MSGSSATTGGFGRTVGSIIAIVVMVALGVGGYYAWNFWKKANDAVQDKSIVTADSLQRAVVATQQTGDAKLAHLTDSLTQRISSADRRSLSAQERYDATVAELTAQRARGDSLLRAAKTRSDTLVAEAAGLERPPPLDSTLAALALQYAADTAAIAEQKTATNICSRALLACSAGRARADSIADFWQVKYHAEQKKIPPKWQSVTVKVAEGLAVAILTHLLFK